MKEPTDESMLLRADEALKQAKGYMLYTADGEGNLWFIGNTTGLNQAEAAGLDAYRKRVLGNLGESSEY